MVLLLLVVLGARPARADAPPSRELRFVTTLGKTRIGQMTIRRTAGTQDGRPIVTTETTSSLRLNVDGPVEQSVRTVVVSDAAGRPLTHETEMRSEGRTTTVRATFAADRAVCEVDAAGSRDRIELPIPSAAPLVADAAEAVCRSMTPVKPGTRTTVYTFEPLGLSIQRVGAEVVRVEELSVRGGKVTGILARLRGAASGVSEVWVEPNGDLLMDESPQVGLRTARDGLVPPTPAADLGPRPDLSQATGIRPARTIADPRHVTQLRLRVSGAPDERYLISDTRQSVAELRREGGAYRSLMTVTARPLPSASLPLAPASSDLALAGAPFLALDDPAIRGAAEEIRRGNPDRVTAARRLRAWVRRRVARPTNIGVPRSAPEILRSGEGVCRDVATLFAAVARAAGLPTRLCAGLIYANGAFVYHAWAECRLTAGDDGWSPIDATLDEDFVDATHVKLIQGDPAEVFQVVGAIGELQIEVLEYR